MQITLVWACRECEAENSILTDTSRYGVLLDADHPELLLANGVMVPVPVPYGRVVSGSEPLELRCASCGHSSGEVGLGYSFQPEHAPSWER